MKKILKEPLLHFLLIGVALFLIYGALNNEKNKNEILIDDNLINELSAKWQLKRNRNPSLNELKGLVDQFIEQEVLYREALDLNLDKNDEIVKRRLAQKMEFISDGMAETLQPTRDMLVVYYQDHIENYKRSSVYSMELVYFNEDKRSNALEDAKKALRSAKPQELGDHISLSSQYTDVSADKIARDYGTAFAKALDSLPTAQWTGPVYSGFGIHIVYISERENAGYYSFDEVDEKVNVDYNYKATNDFKTELITALLKNYTLHFEIENKELKAALNEAF